MWTNSRRNQTLPRVILFVPEKSEGKPRKAGKIKIGGITIN